MGGYVSGADPYPASVQPYSNGVPAIYINAREIPLGSPEYLTVLAHELQHGIHWYADPAEATWLNEGLSELAVTEAGYSPGSVRYYLRRPNASLVNWPKDLDGDIGLNYGAGGVVRPLTCGSSTYRMAACMIYWPDRTTVSPPSMRFCGTTGQRRPAGEPADFHTVFADWMVANLLDDDQGPFGYAGLNVEPNITRTEGVGDNGTKVSLPQYGIDYVEVKHTNGYGTVHFEGDGVTRLLPTDVPEGGCWWSNRGDDTSSTLTRELTVPAAGSSGEEPSLTFDLWYDIEEDWDYLYVQVSTDDGLTWDVLPAEGTTDANPLGNSYGHGYTGSDGWTKVAVPLTDYAGQEAQVRFHYVTDDAIHGIGACVRDMAFSWDNGARDDEGWRGGRVCSGQQPGAAGLGGVGYRGQRGAGGDEDGTGVGRRHPTICWSCRTSAGGRRRAAGGGGGAGGAGHHGAGPVPGLDQGRADQGRERCPGSAQASKGPGEQAFGRIRAGRRSGRR